MKWFVYVVIYRVFVLKCLAMSISELEDFSNFLRETSQLDQNVKSNIPHDDFDEDDPVLDHAWEVSGKFEGDLILNERQRRMILTNVAEGLARNGITDSTKRWPDNEVVYYIQADHFTSGQMEAIQTGINDLAQVSCIKFRPYVKGDRDAVVIQGSRRGCFSQVGYQGGYQVLNLSRRHPVGRGCFRHGTVVHELLHTLGFYHMQSSPDRDDYIDVLWENIVKPARHNFRKYNSFAVSDFGVGYDYDSVLHYSRKAFSSNGQDTIIPKKLGAEIGQRVGLSEKDAQKLNKMYCDAGSDRLIEDSNDTAKKSSKIKPLRNKPFVGHGLGYEQGNLVIIKLPRPEAKQVQDLSHFPVFDDFSKTTQELPPTLFQEVADKKEMNLYLYNSPVSSDDEEYTKSVAAAIPQEQLDNTNLRVLKPYNEEDRNVKKEESSEILDEDLTEAFRVLSNSVKTQVYPLRLPEEYDNSDPRMRLIKESEMKKFNSLFVSPLINDNIKNVNNYVINGPLSEDGNQQSELNYLKLINDNHEKFRETDESLVLAQPFRISGATTLTKTERKNLPINGLWYNDNINHKDANPLDNSYYTPLTNNEQGSYYYIGKEVPTYEKLYKSDQLKHDSYRNRNPIVQEQFKWS